MLPDLSCILSARSTMFRVRSRPSLPITPTTKNEPLGAYALPRGSRLNVLCTVNPLPPVQAQYLSVLSVPNNSGRPGRPCLKHGILILNSVKTFCSVPKIIFYMYCIPSYNLQAQPYIKLFIILCQLLFIASVIYTSEPSIRPFSNFVNTFFTIFF